MNSNHVIVNDKDIQYNENVILSYEFYLRDTDYVVLVLWPLFLMNRAVGNKLNFVTSKLWAFTN